MHLHLHLAYAHHLHCLHHDKAVAYPLLVCQVNDLLKEESAHVKEAFQKLEEFTGSMDHRSKELSQNQQETPLSKDEVKAEK